MRHGRRKRERAARGRGAEHKEREGSGGRIYTLSSPLEKRSEGESDMEGICLRKEDMWEGGSRSDERSVRTNGRLLRSGSMWNICWTDTAEAR